MNILFWKIEGPPDCFGFLQTWNFDAHSKMCICVHGRLEHQLDLHCIYQLLSSNCHYGNRNEKEVAKHYDILTDKPTPIIWAKSRPTINVVCYPGLKSANYWYHLLFSNWSSYISCLPNKRGSSSDNSSTVHTYMYVMLCNDIFHRNKVLT